MQRQFAAASEREPERRGHHRLRRVLQRHVHLLEVVDGGVELVPLLLLRGEQHHHEIRAGGKVLALIADDHRLEVVFELGEARTHHEHDVVAHRVRLAMKIAAEDAIAQIDQRRAGILLHHAAGALEIGEHSDAGARLESPIIGGRADRNIRFAASPAQSATR